MNPRTKWLIVGVAVLGLLYVGDSSYRTFIEEPTKRAEAAIDRLDRQLQDAADTQLVAKKVSQKLDTFAGRSLPHDPAVARSAYQDWLLKLMERHQMIGISIDASNPIPIEIKSRTNKKRNRLIGHRINYTVHSKTALPQWVEWMREFEQAGHLHKIKNLSLVPLGNGSELDVNMTIEALSLQATDRPDTLSDWYLDPQQEPSGSGLAMLVQRNIFARGFSKSLAAIRLQAITFNRRGEGEAWFDIGDNKGTQIITLGDTLKVPIHEVRVLEVLPDRTKLRVNGTEIELTIGKTIGQVLDPTGTSDVPPTEAVTTNTTETAASPAVAVEAPSATTEKEKP